MVPTIIEQSWDTAVFGDKAGALVLGPELDRITEADLSSTIADAMESNFAFISCRVPSSAMKFVHLLENEGFRFVEMIINPWISADSSVDNWNVSTMCAGEASEHEARDILEAIPGLYEHGRLHVDPRVASDVGDRRYVNWIVSSAHRDEMTLLTVKGLDGHLRGFFLFESDAEHQSVKWMLNGMMPKFQGLGIAKKVWSSAMEHHFSNGVQRIETTISLTNIPALTIYSRLGFSFKDPAITLHWLRQQR